MRWIERLEEAPRDLSEPLVWVVRLDGAEAQAAEVRPADLADAAALGSARGAERLIRRRLLRALAGRALGVHPDAVIVERNTAGAPRIVAPEPLCVSHAGRAGWAALAIARTRVGVDVDLAAPESPLPLDLLHPDDRARLAALPAPALPRAFAELWVVKEAYAKASGLTLDAVLAGYPVRTREDGRAEIGGGIAELRTFHGMVAAALTCLSSLSRSDGEVAAKPTEGPRDSAEPASRTAAVPLASGERPPPRLRRYSPMLRMEEIMTT